MLTIELYKDWQVGKGKPVFKNILSIMKEWNPFLEVTHDKFEQLNFEPNLNANQSECPCEQLQKFRRIFPFSLWELGYSHITQHVTDTGDAPLVHIPPTWMNTAIWQMAKPQWREMKVAEVIYPIKSLYSSPVIFKKDGYLHICIY